MYLKNADGASTVTVTDSTISAALTGTLGVIR